LGTNAGTLRHRFKHDRLLLDGATGTELERRGVACPLPLWSAGALVDAPHVVEAIHRDYVEAGADIIVANTFRTNPRTLRNACRSSDGPMLNESAIELARRAARGRDVLIAASLAPLEDCYHPERVPCDDELQAEHAQMAAWLAAAGPDLVWIETMSTVRELHAAATAVAEYDLPFAASVVVRETGELLSGDALEDAVAAVEPLGPLAVGLNCIPPRGMSDILPRLRRLTARPLAAYAHIGNPTPIRGWSYAQDVTPDQYADYARQWLQLGATVVGGCCGTTPAHTRAVRAIIDAGSA